MGCWWARLIGRHALFAKDAFVADHVSNAAMVDTMVTNFTWLGGKAVAADLFDAPATCRKLWPQLVSGVTLDALEEAQTSLPNASDLTDALTAMRTGPWQTVPPVGAGEEHRSEAAGKWHGSVLTLGGNLVHGSLVTAG